MTKEELVNKLKNIVDNYEHFNEEDFCPYDVFGGNMDDAFYRGNEWGYEEGQFDLANEVLAYLSTVT